MNLIGGEQDGARVMVGVRPEDVQVAAAPAPGWDGARSIVVEALGSETLLTLQYRDQRLVARLPGDCRFEPGQEVWIRLPPERALTFSASDGRRIDS